MLILCCRYQNELPKKIKSRGKEGHMTHEELVQLIKWKLAVSVSNLWIFYFLYIFFYVLFYFSQFREENSVPG